VPEATNAVASNPVTATSAQKEQAPAPDTTNVVVGAGLPHANDTNASANASKNESEANASNTSQDKDRVVLMGPPTSDAVAQKKTNDMLKDADSQVDKATRDEVTKEVQECKLDNNVEDLDLANPPWKFTLPCLFKAPMVRCAPWVEEPQKARITHYEQASVMWSRKIKLQSYWILLLGAVMFLFFIFGVYRQQMKKHTKEALGKKTKEQLQEMEERALSSEFHRFFGGLVESAMVILVVDVISAFIPISNVIIYALATEDLLDFKDTVFESSIFEGAIANFCARWHDSWMLASMIILSLFQVTRALAAQGHHPYCVYGRGAWLVYLATDISAMGDTVAILLSAWSLLYCRAVRWNWMLFSFIRVIESLGRWGIGVNFYGFSEEVNEDQSIIRALAIFGLVIWILVGSLYYATNQENPYSQWEHFTLSYANTEGRPKDDTKWQRFESIPSSMFFALLTLNKKNPLAHVFATWYEKLLVVFVNICCVPLFSLVSSMIGGAIMKMVLSQEEKQTEEPTQQGPGTAAAEQFLEDEEEEEEEEEEELDEEEPDPQEEDQVPLWDQWKEFFQSLTWEEHLHPAAIAGLGFGSLFFYGLVTAQRDMHWFFFTVSKIDTWVFPIVDGVVGSLFLADWFHSAFLTKSIQETEETKEAEEVEAVPEAPVDAARSSFGSSVVFQSMSLWRHVAYFLSSVPGMVNCLLCVLEVATGSDVGKGLQFYCLCCLWRIYLLERWLDHPFSSAVDALYACRKQLVTTGAVSLFFWFMGAHLLFFTEYENPDHNIRRFYGSTVRSIWASSFYLNGEWVFCDFSWTGKAVGGFIVLFGVSIVVVPMSVFTGYFLMNLQGDFYQNQVRFLKAEPKDLWQLKMRPGADAPRWRKKIFELLYEHLIQLEKGLRSKTVQLRDSISQQSLSKPFTAFKWTSITASLVFALLTVLENTEYMNTDNCEEYAEETFKVFFKNQAQECKNFFEKVDEAEKGIDVIFLHFFVLEFVLRVIALGWRHFVSELGLAEMLSITGLLVSLTTLREDALHHVDQRVSGKRFFVGSIIFLRLCRLISIGSYFGLLRALRKVTWIARWSLLKSFYFLIAVWFTHAMLLHFAEREHDAAALAGAQILPSAPPGSHWAMEKAPLMGNQSLLQNDSSMTNITAGNLTNVSTLNVSNVTFLLNSFRNRTLLVIPNKTTQSHRYGDYLSAMQYSLQHLTGDYPIVEYTILGRLVLLLGLIIGTCAMAAWTAVFSSGMVNYLANEAEDLLARAAERRMLLAIDVVLRLQRQWRRRKRAREAAIARGDPVVVEQTEMERHGLSLRAKARRLVLRHTVYGQVLMRFFQGVLVFSIAMAMIDSLPEMARIDIWQIWEQRLEIVCTLIFTLELVLMLVAGKGRQGNRWYLFRLVDTICIAPGLINVYEKRNNWEQFLRVEKALHDHTKGKYQDGEFKDTIVLLKALEMIRVIRVLFWHQWRQEVQVVMSGIVSAGPILVVPAFLSLLIWVMSSAMFVWMENVYDGPSKEFFTSIATGMYWTSSFLIGEWTLADFSPGGGNRVCIAIVLFGIMGFGIATGILMEGVQQSIAVAMLESTPFQDLAKMADEAAGRGAQKENPPTDDRTAGKALALPTNRSVQLRRAAKVAAMTQQMAERPMTKQIADKPPS